MYTGISVETVNADITKLNMWYQYGNMCTVKIIGLSYRNSTKWQTGAQ